MAGQPSERLTEEEYEQLVNPDYLASVASQGPASVNEALDAAFQALAQSTGATGQESQEANDTVSGEAVRAIWGSSLEVSQVMIRVFQFVRTFKKESAPLGSEPYYIRVLQQVRTPYATFNLTPPPIHPLSLMKANNRRFFCVCLNDASNQTFSGLLPLLLTRTTLTNFVAILPTNAVI